MPRATDVALRAFLTRSGLNKGNLSAFVADAVHRRLLDLNVHSARARNADVPSAEIEDAIGAALAEVRAERFRNPI